MKLRLFLKAAEGSILPLNYQYEVASWIYNRIHTGDAAHGQWLHTTGARHRHQQFKLFTFGRFWIPEQDQQNGRIFILAPRCTLDISFFLPLAASSFVKGLFQGQRFTIGDRFSKAAFQVREAKVLDEPEFLPATVFESQSPIVVKKTWQEGDRRRKAYLSPEDEGFERRLFDNLIGKYQAYLAQPEATRKGHPRYQLPSLGDLEAWRPDLKFDLLGDTRPVSVTIRAHTRTPSKITGHQFRFRLHAPEPLLRIGYFAGFGSNNSMGFGSTRILSPERFPQYFPHPENQDTRKAS